MIKTLIHTLFNTRLRYCTALITGTLYALCLPPFNSHHHQLLFLMPLLSLIVFIPLLYFGTIKNLRRAFVLCFLWGAACGAAQYYWISFDAAEGLWFIIIIGTILAALYVGLYYAAFAMIAGFIFRRFPRMSIIFIPAAFTLIEYSRTLGEISFPWTLCGYTLSQFLPMAQFASIGGIFGIGFLVMVGNVIIYGLIKSASSRQSFLPRTLLPVGIYLIILVSIAVWGATRMSKAPSYSTSLNTATIALIQSDINQNKWGEGSLDTCLDISEKMAYQAAQQNPDCMVFAESAIFCYLLRTHNLKIRVNKWYDSTHVPVLFGTLHWDDAPAGSRSAYNVYNAAVVLDSAGFKPYFKMRLVPFSEALPFEGLFPIVSRLNLGEADFKKGTVPVVFTIKNKIHAVPLICYEAIYPGDVRKRVLVDSVANLLVNITNDGWFGRTSAPYQHAFMTSMRCIENGISMARCANSGISLFVNQFGQMSGETGLYERTITTGTVSLSRMHTVYTKVGDWPVGLSAIVILIMTGWIIIKRRSKVRE